VKGKLANGVGNQYSHTTSEGGVSSITTADAHTLTASSRLNSLPHRFKRTRPFRRKTKCDFCACAITFRTSCTTEIRSRHAVAYVVRQGTTYCTYCLLSLSIAHSSRRNWITASFTAQAYKKSDEGFLLSWEASLHLVVANTLWRRHTQQYQILRQLPCWHKCQISRKMPIPYQSRTTRRHSEFVSEIMYAE